MRAEGRLSLVALNLCRKIMLLLISDRNRWLILERKRWIKCNIRKASRNYELRADVASKTIESREPSASEWPQQAINLRRVVSQGRGEAERWSAHRWRGAAQVTVIGGLVWFRCNSARGWGVRCSCFPFYNFNLWVWLLFIIVCSSFRLG